MAIDSRWPGARIAVLLQASVEESVEVGDAYGAVARIPELVWTRSRRARRESMVAEVLVGF